MGKTECPEGAVTHHHGPGKLGRVQVRETEKWEKNQELQTGTPHTTTKIYLLLFMYQAPCEGLHLNYPLFITTIIWSIIIVPLFKSEKNGSQRNYLHNVKLLLSTNTWTWTQVCLTLKQNPYLNHNAVLLPRACCMYALGAKGTSFSRGGVPHTLRNC